MFSPHEKQFFLSHKFTVTYIRDTEVDPTLLHCTNNGLLIEVSGWSSYSQEPRPLWVPNSWEAVLACYKMKDKLYPDARKYTKTIFQAGSLEMGKVVPGPNLFF